MKKTRIRTNRKVRNPALAYTSGRRVVALPYGYADICRACKEWLKKRGIPDEVYNTAPHPKAAQSAAQPSTPPLNPKPQKK